MVYIFYFLNNLNNSNKLLNDLENSLDTTKNLFEEQKRYSLSLAILLSEDKEIIESFLKQDREESFKVINRKIKTLKQLQDSNFEVQIHNKSLTTYLRSWDIDIKNIPLSSFRQGLVKVKQSKQPLVSIELGKRLNIKAISPIIENNEYIGSIETIIDFEYLSKELKKKGYELFVLLDKKHLNIASDLKSNPSLNNYTLVNSANIHVLEKLNLDDLKDYGYVSTQEHSFVYFVYSDLNNNPLGYILTGIKNNKQINISNNFDYEVINIDSKVEIR